MQRHPWAVAFYLIIENSYMRRDESSIEFHAGIHIEATPISIPAASSFRNERVRGAMWRGARICPQQHAPFNE